MAMVASADSPVCAAWADATTAANVLPPWPEPAREQASGHLPHWML